MTPGSPDFTDAGDAFYSPSLSALPWLAHDVIVPDAERWRADRAGAVRQPSARLAPAAGDVTIIGRQTHGDGVAIVARADAIGPRPAIGGLALLPPTPNHVELPDTDAIILLSTGLIAAVATADCVPIIVADTAHRRVAVVHAGWRGTWARILSKTLSRLLELGARSEDLRLWIGPCIQRRNYEVDPDLANRFARAFPDAPDAVSGRRLDLPRLNAAMAQAMGVKTSAIADAGVCVYEDPRFPSYRRDGDQAGRLLTRVGTRPAN